LATITSAFIALGLTAAELGEQTRTGGIDINRTNMAPLASFVGKANIFGFALPFPVRRIISTEF